MQSKLFACFIIMIFFSCSSLRAQRPDDVTIDFYLMRITEIKVGTETQTPEFLRQNLSIFIGKRQGFIGFKFQRSTKGESTVIGVEENGFVLLAGYDWVLNGTFRLDVKGSLGLFSDTNPAQPLYATDTELQTNLVWFTPYGFGYWKNHSFFPSAYVGAIVNDFGRLQGIVGVGAWWNGIGLYATGFHAFNGLDDPTMPGSDADKAFAFLKNRGIDVSMSYTIGSVGLELRRNIPIVNSGNNTVLKFNYRYNFNRE